MRCHSLDDTPFDRHIRKLHAEIIVHIWTLLLDISIVTPQFILRSIQIHDDQEVSVGNLVQRLQPQCNPVRSTIGSFPNPVALQMFGWRLHHVEAMYSWKNRSRTIETQTTAIEEEIRQNSDIKENELKEPQAKELLSIAPILRLNRFLVSCF